MKKLLDGKEIHLIARNHVIPKYMAMFASLDDLTAYADAHKASEVFRELALDLRSLSDIFPPNRQDKTVLAEDWDQLGDFPVGDDQSWSKLAVLMGRDLHVWHQPYGDICQVYNRAVYRSSGEIEIINKTCPF